MDRFINKSRIVSNGWLTCAISFIVSIASLQSCMKDSGPTLATGKVIDKNTGKPVSGAEIYLKQRTAGTPAYYMGGVVIDNLVTSSDGSFLFSFEAAEEYEYHVEAHGHIMENDNYVEIQNKGKKNNDLVIYILPKAYLKIYVKNVTKKYNYFTCSNTFHERMGGFFEGYEVDTFAIGTVYGNANDNIMWGTTDNNGNPGYDSVITKYFPAYDTSIYHIHY